MRIILYSFVCFILSVISFSCSTVKKHTQEKEASTSLNFGNPFKGIDYMSWYFYTWKDSIDYRNNFGTERRAWDFYSLLEALPIDSGVEALSYLFSIDNEIRQGQVEEIYEREKKIVYLYDTNCLDSLLNKFAEFSYFHDVAKLHGGLPDSLAFLLRNHVSHFVNMGYLRTPYLYVLYKLEAIDNFKKNNSEMAQTNISKAIELCKQVYERKDLGELYAWASIFAKKRNNEGEALSFSDSAQLYNADSTAAIFSRELPESYNSEYLKPYLTTVTTSNIDISPFLLNNIAIKKFNQLESLVKYNFDNNRDNDEASKKYLGACDFVYKYIPQNAVYDMLSHVRHVTQIYSIPKDK